MEKKAVAKSKELHEEAKALIFGSGLHDILSSYGTVHYTGSYDLDLMVWPDLDITICMYPNPYSVDRFFQLGNDIVKRNDIVSMRFRNFVRFPVSDLPIGLYWKVRISRGKDVTPWKIDLWAMDRKTADENLVDMKKIEEQIEERTKRLIVDIKYSLLTPEGRTPSLSGYHIYQAVLIKGIEDRNSVVAYLRQHGINIEGRDNGG